MLIVARLFALRRPAQQLRELFNVNQFIVSQVNPHVAPLFRKQRHPKVPRLLQFIGSELDFRLQQLIDVGVFPAALRGTSGQRAPELACGWHPAQTLLPGSLRCAAPPNVKPQSGLGSQKPRCPSFTVVWCGVVCGVALPNALPGVRGTISQTYTGDITIVPDMDPDAYTKLIANPTPEFLTRSLEVGERATWPHVGMIETRCKIELALERIVARLCNKA